MNKNQLIKLASLLQSFSDEIQGTVFDETDIVYNLVLKTIHTKFGLSAEAVFAEFNSVDANNELREQLAEYAHEAWSGWMNYLLSKCQVNVDGTWMIPAQSTERWYRQMTTPYHLLPESEKKSDRDEADKMLNIVIESAGYAN